MDNNVVIRSSHIDRITNRIRDKKAAYFCAYTGSGKTTLIKQYMENKKRKYAYLSCRDEDFSNRLKIETANGTRHIVIDDVQEGGKYMYEITTAICESRKETRYYIIGRSRIPEYLMPFSIADVMVDFDQKFFAFTAEEIQEIFIRNGKSISISTASKIKADTGGWVLAVLVYVNNYEENRAYSDINRMCTRDVFEYFNERLWMQFSEGLRNMMIRIGHLSEFTIDQAKKISGETEAEKHVAEAETLGSFIKKGNDNVYYVEALVNEYLKWKQRTEYTKEFRNDFYKRTAEYFEGICDIPNAVKYYGMSEANDKVVQLLEENAEKHEGNGNFYKLKDYYTALPDDYVGKKPALISALSMVYSISGDPEKSEEYRKRLETYVRLTEDKDKRKEAMGKLAYLNIVLAHRGIKDLDELIKAYSTSVVRGVITLQEFGITGNMPSVMNGGKDLCAWTKRERTMYRTLKSPVSIVMGKRSNGAAEIALGESLFEKSMDGNYAEALILANSGYYEGEQAGNIQLQFAALAVISRIYTALGKPESAVAAIDKLMGRVSKTDEIYKNIEAFRVYLSMLIGESKAVNAWFEKKAPDENDGFYIMDRYRYIVKIRIYIIKGMYDEALSLLSRIEQYINSYERFYLYIDVLILKSILYYRMKNEDWRGIFSDTVEKCREYGFIRAIARYGNSIYDLLSALESEPDDDYVKELMIRSKRQALYYPNYMKAEKSKDYGLTDSEKKVLKLVCDGLSNEEIARLTDVAVRTVKFHLSNIYTKLNVRGRTAAINLCYSNGIL